MFSANRIRQTWCLFQWEAEEEKGRKNMKGAGEVSCSKPGGVCRLKWGRKIICEYIGHSYSDDSFSAESSVMAECKTNQRPAVKRISGPTSSDYNDGTTTCKKFKTEYGYECPGNAAMPVPKGRCSVARLFTPALFPKNSSSQTG